MKLLIVFLAVMFITFTTTAAPAKSKAKSSSGSNSSTKSLKSISDIHKQLKESAFKLSHSQYHFLGADKDGQVLRSDFILNDTYLSYNFDRQNDMRFMNRSTTAISERTQASHHWFWIELRYRRNRILTEDKNFLNFSAEVRADYIPDEKRRASTVTNGFVRPQLNFSKNFTKSFSTDLSFFTMIFDRRSGKTVPGQRLVRSDRIVFSPNYVVNDKTTLSLGITYLHDLFLDNPENRNMNGGDAGEFVHSDYFWINPAINYVITDWVNVDLDVGATTHTSHDSRFWIKNMQAQYWIGAAFNLQVF